MLTEWILKEKWFRYLTIILGPHFGTRWSKYLFVDVSSQLYTTVLGEKSLDACWAEGWVDPWRGSSLICAGNWNPCPGHRVHDGVTVRNGISCLLRTTYRPNVKESAFVQRVNSVAFLPITMYRFISVMNTVLSDVTPCNLVADTNISKKPVVTTLRVEERSKFILNFTPDYTAPRRSRGCAI